MFLVFLLRFLSIFSWFDGVNYFLYKLYFCWFVFYFLKAITNLFGDRSGGLDDVDGATGNCRGGDEGAVLGTDHVQVGFGDLGAVLSGLQFALEATSAGDRLCGHTLLKWTTEWVSFSS